MRCLQYLAFASAIVVFAGTVEAGGSPCQDRAGRTGQSGRRQRSGGARRSRGRAAGPPSGARPPSRTCRGRRTRRSGRTCPSRPRAASSAAPGLRPPSSPPAGPCRVASCLPAAASFRPYRGPYPVASCQPARGAADGRRVTLLARGTRREHARVGSSCVRRDRGRHRAAAGARKLARRPHAQANAPAPRAGRPTAAAAHTWRPMKAAHSDIDLHESCPGVHS